MSEPLPVGPCDHCRDNDGLWERDGNDDLRRCRHCKRGKRLGEADEASKVARLGKAAKAATKAAKRRPAWLAARTTRAVVSLTLFDGKHEASGGDQ